MVVHSFLQRILTNDLEIFSDLASAHAITAIIAINAMHLYIIPHSAFVISLASL